MNKKILFFVTIYSTSLWTMEQEEQQKVRKEESEEQKVSQSKFPSLIELAALEAGKWTKIGSPTFFEKLSGKAQQQIITQYGTWEDLFSAVDKNKIDVSDELLNKIGNKLISELLSGTMTLQGFMNKFKNLPEKVQKHITIHFKDKIEEFLNPSTVTLLKLKLVWKDADGRIAGEAINTLPQEFRVTEEGKTLKKILNISKVTDPNYLIPLFIAQEIEQQIIDKNLTTEQMGHLVKELIEFVKKVYKNSKPLFLKYFEDLENILTHIMRDDVSQTDIELFERSKEPGEYILKKQ